MKHFPIALCAAALGIGALASAPAAAQDGDITVFSPFVELPDGRMLSSQAVSYADLDLTYADHRAELRRRVSMTAREVCNRLRRYNDGPVMNSDCESGAYRGALTQVRANEGDWAIRR